MPGRDFRGVVADADDGVGAQLAGVGDHVRKASSRACSHSSV